MWTCDRCGRTFANTNQWHSCTSMSVDESLRGTDDRVIAIYRAVEAAVVTDPAVRIHAQKTRIAFISRMSFAGVRPARRWMDFTFIADRPIGHERIRRIDAYGPTSFGHEVRLGDPGDVDDELRTWIAIARLRGDQVTLDETAIPDEADDVARPLLRIPLRARPAATGGGTTFEVPSWVHPLLGDGPVWVRIGRTIHPGALVGADAVEIRPSEPLGSVREITVLTTPD